MSETNTNRPLIIIGLIIICLIITLILIPKNFVFFSKTTTTNQTTTLENSYLFASPVQAKADNQEKIRVVVLVLDGRGLGVANQTVTLKLPQHFTSIRVQSITDESGKAIFDISSLNQGTYDLSAQSNNKEIPQKLRVVFY